jgi:hypothetical protein
MSWDMMSPTSGNQGLKVENLKIEGYITQLYNGLTQWALPYRNLNHELCTLPQLAKAM